ncbi:hypothetical protein GGR50DRAFT_664834 [Xylaria sp. CBS 124048]|nr:hypothetical protein GGR50DRAFT_664834 [Xylaria sp. CBS 124048]
MTDHDTGSLSRPNSPNSFKRSLGRSSIPRSSSSYGSYSTAESGTHEGFPYDTSIDAVTFRSSSPHDPKEASADQRPEELEEEPEQPEQTISEHVTTHRRHRSQKPRPNNGFLLPNSLADEGSQPRPKSGSKNGGSGRRRSRIPIDVRRSKSSLSSFEDHASEPSKSHNSLNRPKRAGAQSAHTPNSKGDVRDVRPYSVADRRISRIPSSSRPESTPFDVDSTQIVSMALNLSESRRLASRRNLSGPVPLGLAPLPENTTSRSLSQQLQQRRSPRSISPRVDAKLSPRIASTPKLNSFVQPAHDHDGNFTYHFSSSTLQRAQRAKEYLELMAQYRRVLLFLPPLKQETRSRPSTSGAMASADPTESPHSVISSSQSRVLGRAYNPLQYIRNRKIRTRERKTIDGEALGFGDVIRVTDWIDEVAAYAAASPLAESPKLPPYPTADESIKQQLPASNIPRPVASINKTKRPRFEWSIEPADMLADIYWLEQSDNKFLIEDRNYNKIFTPKPTTQPTSLSAEQNRTGLVVPPPKENLDSSPHGVSDIGIAQSIKADVETTLTNTRDRARQKLQDLRVMHHKHSNSISHHDFLRLRRASLSESSENESDRRRRGRSNTLSASGQDLLEKQMNDMLARESQDEPEQSLQKESEAVYLKPKPTAFISPLQPSHSRQHSRNGSLTETMELADKASQPPSIASGRTSLEVPAQLIRSSIDLDTPRPPLSDLASRGRRHGYVTAIGMDLSPNPSRPSSPARNPFLKVKNMFRDPEDRENDDKVVSFTDPMRTTGTPAAVKAVIQPIERSRSKSSTREFVSKITHEPRSHRTIGSLNIRPDEQVGLRTIFKSGAKLDDMIRGSVSKVTDMIWKKDSDASSGSSGDDSDTDDWRGRRRVSGHHATEGSSRQHQRKRSVKNYLDIMPNFKSTSDSIEKLVSHEANGPPLQVLSTRPPRSPRFDQLKPPRIDVKVPPVPPGSRNITDFETPEIDFHSRDSNRLINKPSLTSKEVQSALSMHTGHAMSHAGDMTIALSHTGFISRSEVARLRALILCSGIKAMEISRRANEPHPLLGPDNIKALGLPSTDVERFALGEPPDLHVAQTQLFPTTARIFASNIDHSMKMIEASASKFATDTAPDLRQRVDAIHTRIAIEFMEMTRRAADEADDVSHDLVDSQRLKVKSVVDTIDKMLRRRRRRFRYVRRAGWLAVEWVLVGFMWYVWFIVMIMRILLGAGRGVVSVARWLLWI